MSITTLPSRDKTSEPRIIAQREAEQKTNWLAYMLEHEAELDDVQRVKLHDALSRSLNQEARLRYGCR